MNINNIQNLFIQIGALSSKLEQYERNFLDFRKQSSEVIKQNNENNAIFEKRMNKLTKRFDKLEESLEDKESEVEESETEVINIATSSESEETEYVYFKDIEPSKIQENS